MQDDTKVVSIVAKPQTVPREVLVRQEQIAARLWPSCGLNLADLGRKG